MYNETILLGVVLSLIFTEITGLSAGLIVPGYLALYLHSPGRIVCTLLLAAAAVGLCIGPHTLTAAAMCYVPLCVGIMTQQPLMNGVIGYHPECQNDQWIDHNNRL